MKNRPASAARPSLPYRTSKLFLASLFQGAATGMNDSSEKAHGVQALACRFGPLENGSRKLKLELHALFSLFQSVAMRHEGSSKKVGSG